MKYTAEEQAEQRIADLCWLMGHEAGRRLMRWIIYDVAGLQHMVANVEIFKIKDGIDAALHAFHKDGGRRVGSILNQALAAVPLDLREAMLIEAFHEERMREASTGEFTTGPEGRA